jgi:TPR repeat protein
VTVDLRGRGIAPREGFLRLALRRYRHDAGFRGMVEFAAIGAVVLTLLHYLPASQLDSVLDLIGNRHRPASEGPPPKSTAPEPGHSAIPASLGDLIAHSVDQLFPRLPLPGDIGIDTALFASSSEAVQPTLKAAAKIYRSSPQEALQSLADLDPADRNVMLLRGLALVSQPGSANAAAGMEQLEKAIAAGQRQGAAFLGLLLVSGPGFKHDPERGWELLKQAAEAGDASVARVLGVAHYTGSLGVADPKKAVMYMRQAADRGDAAALLRLAHFAYRGIGMPKDDAEGERLATEAAEAGSTDAQFTLGLFYKLQYQTGWVNDGAAVVRWLAAASEAGSPLAMFSLGEFYLTARGPWHDEAKGVALFRRCSVGMSDPCLFGLASVLQRGEGVERDIVKADALYRQVQGKNGPKARQIVAELEANMSPAEREKAQHLARADSPGAPNVLREWAEPDANGCIQIGATELCPMRPDPRLPTFQSRQQALQPPL